MSNKRQKRQRTIAIWLILSLILSFLIGALTVTPSPAGATETPAAAVDTDGDGIENNLDPDVDGDSIVNGEDDDIDGDGIGNFDDADPIDTTDIDSNDPQKPIRPSGGVADFFADTAWIWISIFMTIVSFVATWITVRRRTKNRNK
jgi:hypothetical protein